MAKQKIVVKIGVNNDKKSRKALKIAVSVTGMESVSFVGANKDQLALTGEGIDSVELAKLLRKGVGYMELVSVGTVDPAPTASAPTSAAAGQTPMVPPVYTHHYNYPVPYHVYEVPYNNDPSCTIM